MGSAFERLGYTEDDTTIAPTPTAVQQPVVTPQASAYANLTGTQDEEAVEQGMELILGGLPDNGRILRDRNTKQLHFVSQGYSTSNQDEIKRIIDEGKQGEVVDLGAEAESKFQRDILGQLPESGLLAQQFFSGGVGGGSWMDEAVTDNPLDKWRYEKTQKAYQEEYPERAYPAQIGGLAASTYLTGGALSVAGKLPKAKDAVNVVKNWYSKLPPLGQKTAQVGGTTLLAGYEGLLYGAGEGNTLDERTVNALQTGGLNMAITAPIATAFPVIGGLINRFKPDKAKISAIATKFGISVEAARFLKDAFESGASIAEMMEKVARAGDDRMIADANTAFTKLLDAAATVSPSQGAQVQQAVGERVAKSSTKLAGDLDTTLGFQPQGEQTIIEKVGKDSASARGDAYTKAYDHVVDYKSTVGQKIKSVLNRVDPTDMEEAITEANKMLRDKGLTQFQVMARFDEFGNLSLEKDLNFVQLDYIKRGLDTLGTKIDNIGQPTPSAVRSQGQSRDLRNAMVEGNPAYGDALALGQGKIKTQQAIVLGSKLLNAKTTLDEVKRMVRNASKDELSGARQGIREQIENIMSNAKTASTTGRPEDVSEAMKLITTMSSRSVRLKVEQILGKKTSDALYKRLDESRSAIELQAGTRTGSATASRQEIMGTAERMIERGPVGTFFEVDPVGAVKKLRDFFAGVGDDYIQSRKEDIFKEVANVLTMTGRGGKDVDKALQYLEKVRRGENLSKPQASFLTLMIKNGLQSTTAPIVTGVGVQRGTTQE